MGRKPIPRYEPYPRNTSQRADARKFLRGRFPTTMTEIGQLNGHVERNERVQTVATSNSMADLPQELLFKIFKHTSLDDLGVISQTNKTIRDAVLIYVVSNEFGRKIVELFREPVPSSMRNIYKRVGYVIKRATCILPTPKRLEIAEAIYRLNGPQDLVTFPAIALAWGTLVKAFVSGWAYNECERVYKAVCTFGSREDINMLVNQFLLSVPGVHRVLEKRLRTFFRSVFLEPHLDRLAEKPADDDFGFYLDLILREHSTYYQAKLLYLLFGPESEGSVQWHFMCSQNVEETDQYNDMGYALCSLLDLVNEPKRNRTLSQLVALVEEMTSFPDNWTLYNFACLLDKCGDCVVKVTLGSRIINGRIREACEIFACLTLISARNDLPMEARVKLFLTILHSVRNKATQMAVISELVKTHYRRLGQIMIPFSPMGLAEELSASELFYAEYLRMAFFRALTNPEI